jgi:hypothetical protein
MGRMGEHSRVAMSSFSPVLSRSLPFSPSPFLPFFVRHLLSPELVPS